VRVVELLVIDRVATVSEPQFDIHDSPVSTELTGIAKSDDYASRSSACEWSINIDNGDIGTKSKLIQWQDLKGQAHILVPDAETTKHLQMASDEHPNMPTVTSCPTSK
jgi:hypothetical protein